MYRIFLYLDLIIKFKERFFNSLDAVVKLAAYHLIKIVVGRQNDTEVVDHMYKRIALMRSYTEMHSGFLY